MSLPQAHQSTLAWRQANRAKAVPGRTIVMTVRRCEGPGKLGWFESFKIPVEPNENVISCLQKIAANPVTADGKETTPVVWDSGCLEEVCGACTMVINGTVRQSCSCLIDEYAPEEGDEITLEPMSKFPVIRDLWVDRARLFNSLKRVRGWVPIDSTAALGPGPKEDQATQSTRYAISECMSCGCCLEACPQFLLEGDEDAWDSAFIGAHAIAQARLFNLHGTGKNLAPERLDELMGPGGVADCGNAQNCVKVCPKGVPLTESIGAMGRGVTMHAVTRFFKGK
ncbi:MAG: succinate dehydrogenase iron-sulfur subunit [Phycisphaeraceae bacterium]|nr:MAG: succinate dehydrogenase iron-sulfur subunit [Phycisphaeraceae bacterium]